MGRIRFGCLINFRNPPGSGQDFSAVYRASLRLAARAEGLGFDSVWLTEHHFTDDGYLPSIFPVAGAIASRTRRVQIGTYVALFPFYHPLRLAEDAAVVDVISGGRLRLGTGLAYRDEEFATFGIKRTERVERTFETIEILRKAWTGEPFSFQGKYFSFPEVRVLPSPISQPHPELLLGVSASRLIDRAAQMDLSFASVGSKREAIHYVDSLKALGKDPANYSIVGNVMVYVAETPQKAWNEAGKSMTYLAECYNRWMTKAASGNATAFVIRSDPETVRKNAILGPPEVVRERLARILENSPQTDLILTAQLPGMDPALTERCVDRLGNEVIPFFR